MIREILKDFARFGTPLKGKRLSIDQAQAEIKSALLENAPNYKKDWEYEPIGALYGYKKCDVEWRKHIAALFGEGK
jgi:hypothetical protein